MSIRWTVLIHFASHYVSYIHAVLAAKRGKCCCGQCSNRTSQSRRRSIDAVLSTPFYRQTATSSLRYMTHNHRHITLLDDSIRAGCACCSTARSSACRQPCDGRFANESSRGDRQTVVCIKTNMHTHFFRICNGDASWKTDEMLPLQASGDSAAIWMLFSE